MGALSCGGGRLLNRQIAASGFELVAHVTPSQFRR